MHFLVDVTIHEPLKAAPLLPAHLAYLNQHFDQGDIVIFAAYEDRSGGMMIVKADSEEALQALLAKDPLRREYCASWYCKPMKIARVKTEGLLAREPA